MIQSTCNHHSVKPFSLCSLRLDDQSSNDIELIIISNLIIIKNLGIEGIFCSIHVADHRSNVANNCGKKENSTKHVEADIQISEGKFETEMLRNEVLEYELSTYSTSLTG